MTKNNDTPTRGGGSKLIADKTIAPVNSQELLGNPSQGSIGFLRHEGGLTNMTKYAQNIKAGGATIESPDKTRQRLGVTMLNDDTPNLGQGESPMMSEKNKANAGNGMDTSTHLAEK